MILEDFSGHDISEFMQDFFLLIKMGTEVDEMYSEGNNLFYQNKAIFEKYCRLFTQKYAPFSLETFVKGAGKSLKIFLPDQDVVKIFREVAVRIEGLVGVSNLRDLEVPANDREKLARALVAVRDKMYINYNPDSIILEYRKEEDKVELVYDPQTILKNKENSPEFKLCCYYALKGGYDRNIDLQDAAKGFVFHTRPDIHSGRFSGF